MLDDVVDRWFGQLSKTEERQLRTILSASQTQSNPTRLPFGATNPKVNVVHGKKRNPRKDQAKFSKARSQRGWSASHQTRIANRGPTSINATTKQHILN